MKKFSSISMTKKTKRAKANIRHEKGHSRVKCVRGIGIVSCSSSDKKATTCPMNDKEELPITCAVSDRERKTMEKEEMENFIMDKGEEEQKNADKKLRQENEFGEVKMASDEEIGEIGSKSLGENVRWQIQERNLQRYKMLRTQAGLKYEVDLTEQEKKQYLHDERKYQHSHVGFKIVETSLIPSTRLSSRELNKAKILRYVRRRGYKVREVREFARVEFRFDSYLEANECHNGNENQDIIFEISGRAKTCKGVITVGTRRHSR